MTTTKPKLVSAFYVDPFAFTAGARVLIVYEAGVFAVQKSAHSNRIDALHADITWISARNYSHEQDAGAHETIVLRKDGTVDARTATELTGFHSAVSIVPGTLWDHYRAGGLPTCDLRYHLDYMEMRTIAGAMVEAGDGRAPVVQATVCELLGITRHRLRRRLARFGMPSAQDFRDRSLDWQREVAAFAQGGKREVSEERSADHGLGLGEQLPSTRPRPVPDLPEQLAAVEQGADVLEGPWS